MKNWLIPVSVSLLVHGFLALFVFYFAKNFDDAVLLGLWRGGSFGDGSGVTYISLAPVSGENLKTENTTSKKEITSSEQSKKSALQIQKKKTVSKQKNETTSKQGKQSSSQASRFSGSGQGDGVGNGLGSGVDSQGTDQATVLALIRKKIAKNYAYPLMAREQGFEGVVRVYFQINSDGSLQSVKVISSSGHSSLDEAALKAVKKSVPLPYFEKPIALPIEFKLR